ncbi:hypothetical protein [Isoptericola croceus]|uniref:hypothetical protein n=1 Tax=Isoptericola croceus TaxID=3031406 RepID=UPI0023F68AA1|nr:hypothetical protein [Isoptericola croceus]
MDPLTVLALAQLDEECRAVVGRLPERPGRDPELAEAVLRQIEADDPTGDPASISGNLGRTCVQGVCTRAT